MQDFNYWKHGCLEVAVELTCCKYPPASTLSQLWYDNKNSLIEYLKLANNGVKGTVKFFNNQPASRLSIQINSINPVFKVSEIGEFYRILETGSYGLSVLLNCQVLHQEKFIVSADGVPTIINIVLNETIYNLYSANASQLNKDAQFCGPIFIEASNNAAKLGLSLYSSSFFILFSLIFI